MVDAKFTNKSEPRSTSSSATCSSATPSGWRLAATGRRLHRSAVAGRAPDDRRKHRGRRDRRVQEEELLAPLHHRTRDGADRRALPVEPRRSCPRLIPPAFIRTTPARSRSRSLVEPPEPIASPRTSSPSFGASCCGSRSRSRSPADRGSPSSQGRVSPKQCVSRTKARRARGRDSPAGAAISTFQPTRTGTLERSTSPRSWHRTADLSAPEEQVFPRAPRCARATAVRVASRMSCGETVAGNGLGILVSPFSGKPCSAANQRCTNEKPGQPGGSLCVSGY